VTSDSSPVGVVVIRVWVEGPDRRLRARVTQTLDVTEREQMVRAAGTPEGVEAIVREWIAAFLAATRSGPGGTVTPP
jgi:MoxR-like ATPase